MAELRGYDLQPVSGDPFAADPAERYALGPPGSAYEAGATFSDAVLSKNIEDRQNQGPLEELRASLDKLDRVRVDQGATPRRVFDETTSGLETLTPADPNVDLLSTITRRPMAPGGGQPPFRGYRFMPDQPATGDPWGEQAQGAEIPITSGPSSARIGWAIGQEARGIAGSAWDAFTAPKRAYSGQIAPGDMLGEGLNMAGWVTAPGLGRAAMVGPAENVLGMSAASDVASGMAQGKGITAYHGSPYDFDRFDISRIGTGEGAQVYGHGLYFAENEGTARRYRDMDHPAIGSDPRDDVKGLRQAWEDYQDDYSTAEDMTPLQAKRFMNRYDSLRPHMDNTDIVTNILRYVNGHDVGSGFITTEGMYALKALDSQLPPKPQGKMYQVSINADPEHFLDLDKPLSEQSPKVQEAIGSVIGQPNLGRFFDLSRQLEDIAMKPAAEHAANPQLTQQWDAINNERASLGVDPRLATKDGGQAHWIASVNRSGDAGAAAAALRDAGIPGIKYLDAGSRGSGAGTHNYVTFSDDIVQILKKYGIAGLGIGTASGLSHFQMQPQDGDPYANQ